jgi:sarcosine oxidase
MVYAEGGHYTPLLQRARDLWRELEAACGTDLPHVTGVVTIMDDDHPDRAALLRAGRERGLSFEVATAEEARRRLPQHTIRDRDVALFDPEGGYVRSEHAVFSALRLAQRRGASFLGNRKVMALERHRDQWSVRTDQEEVRRSAGADCHRNRRRGTVRCAGNAPGPAPSGAHLVSHRGPRTPAAPAGAGLHPQVT